MQTLSSIGVGPRPQQASVVNPPPPVASGRVGASVSPDKGAGVVVSVPSGDGTGAQTTYLPSSLPPVTVPDEAQRAALPKNLRAATADEPSVSMRFKGELPVEPKSPVDVALDQQIEDFIPNLWKASRAAVDALAAKPEEVGAMAAGPAPPAPAAASPDPTVAYVETEGGKSSSAPGALIDIEV